MFWFCFVFTFVWTLKTAWRVQSFLILSLPEHQQIKHARRYNAGEGRREQISIAIITTITIITGILLIPLVSLE